MVIRAGPILTHFSQDTELEDDDDGSTTVTNSTVNLVQPTAPILAEELVAKLGSVTATSVEEDESPLEPPAEGPFIAVPLPDDSAADPPSHTMDSPSDDEPVVDSGIPVQEPTTEAITVNGLPPSEPSSDMAGLTVDPVHVDQRAAAGTGLEIIAEEVETSVGDDLPSQEQDVEPWIPDGEIPIIVISPPSEVDPEDYAQQFDSEEEPEDILYSDSEDELEPESAESEDDDNSEPGYAEDYTVRPVTEVLPELPPSPVEAKDDPCHSPWRSPIIVTGMLWSDDEGNSLGPLPFTEEIVHVEEVNALEIGAPEPSDAAEIAEHPEAVNVFEQAEAQVSVGEEGALETVTAALEDSSGAHFTHIFP